MPLLLGLALMSCRAVDVVASECRPDCPAPPLQIAVDLSASVFRGTVTSIRHVPRYPFGLYYRVNINVDTVWKGNASGILQVMTTSDVDGCAFLVDGLFLVFAQSIGGQFYAAGCNRTHLT